MSDSHAPSESRIPIVDAADQNSCTGAAQAAVEGDGHRLVERYFSMPRLDGVALRHVEVDELDTSLRSLLFTDGTVTRALEVLALAPVVVDVVDQAQTPLPLHASAYLATDSARGCIRRRVRMTMQGVTVMWAESHILPERLPPAFLRVLGTTPEGIGSSMETLKLESRRDLLCFGLGLRPRWDGCGDSSGLALIRLYRVVTERQPALLISEAFAIDRSSDRYHLASEADHRPSEGGGGAPGIKSGRIGPAGVGSQ